MIKCEICGKDGFKTDQALATHQNVNKACKELQKANVAEEETSVDVTASITTTEVVAQDVSQETTPASEQSKDERLKALEAQLAALTKFQEENAKTDVKTSPKEDRFAKTRWGEKHLLNVTLKDQTLCPYWVRRDKIAERKAYGYRLIKKSETEEMCDLGLSFGRVNDKDENEYVVVDNLYLMAIPRRLKLERDAWLEEQNLATDDLERQQKANLGDTAHGSLKEFKGNINNKYK